MHYRLLEISRDGRREGPVWEHRAAQRRVPMRAGVWITREMMLAG
jgi:hypothetical protein